MRGTRVAAVMLAAVAMVGLTGCEPGALSPDPSETAEATTPSESTTTPTGEPTEEPSETPVPTVDPVASGDLDLVCDQVATPQQVYDLNPNFAATDAPSAGVPAQVQAVADAGGTVCAWQHTTNGDPLIAAVAYAAEAPNDAAIDASEGSLYILGEIVDDYWIVVASPYFSAGEPGASDLVAAIAGNLPNPEES